MFIKLNKSFFIICFIFANISINADVVNDHTVPFAFKSFAGKQQFIQDTFKQVPYIHKYNSIITQVEWAELEYELIIKKLDRTQTAAGFWGLKELAVPIADIAQLDFRQNIIKKIINQKEFADQLNNYLQTIKSLEDDTYTYWDTNDLLRGQVRALRYSIFDPYTKEIDDTLNRNKVTLELSILAEIGKSCLGLATLLGVTGLTNQIRLSLFENKPFNAREAIVSGVMRPVTINVPYSVVYKDGYSENKSAQLWSEGTMSDYYISAHEGDKYNKFFSGAYALSVVGIYDLFFALNLRDSTQKIKSLHQSCLLLQHRMVNMAKLFATMEELHQLIRKNENLFDTQLADLLDISKKSDKFQKLNQLLKCSTFKEPAKYFFSRGNVLLADQFMFDVKDELIVILQAISLLDGYSSIAKLLGEHVAGPFTFVQFNQDPVANVQLTNFWTPLLQFRQPVLNSLACDQQHRNKILITGPSGGGKSIVMKAVAHIIMLGQSWTIAPAQIANMSLFTGLRTSLIPRENTQQNISTFMAGMQRIDAIGQFIKNATEGDRYFTIFDEPYNGIVEAESAQRVFGLAGEIENVDNCCAMMALHIYDPVNLEQTTTKFANYQVLTDAANDDEPTYKLATGPSLWWFTDTARRKKYVDLLKQKIVANQH